MKAAILAVCLLLVAVPATAATYLELSSSPNIAMQWEGAKLALKLGLGASYYSQTYLVGFGGPQDISVLVFSPVLTGQCFLNQDPKARSFVELSVAKGVPIINGYSENYFDQLYDDWSFGTGAGLRSNVADRLNLGAAAGLGLTLRTQQGQKNQVSASTSFRVFLQYRL